MTLLVLTKVVPTSQLAQYSLFVGLAFFTMLMVKHGDSKVQSKKGLDAFDVED